MQHNHLIHHVILDLQIASDENSFDKANDLVDEYKNSILDTISDVFDVFDADVYLLIEHLHIDIGHVQSFEQLKYKLKQELQRNLFQYLQTEHNNVTSEASKSSSQIEEPQNIASPTIVDILFFLENGKFKWEHHKKLFKDKKKFPYFEELLVKYFRKINVEEFFQIVGASPNLIFRLWYYFPGLNDAVLKLIIPEWFLSNLYAYSYSKNRLEAQLNLLSKSRSKIQLDQFFEVIQSIHQQVNTPNLILVLLWLIEKVEEINTLADFFILSHLNHIRQRLLAYNIQTITQEIYSLSGIQLQEKELKSIFVIINTGIKSKQIHRKATEKNDDVNLKSEDVQNLKYCGVIFLHTYLNEVFEKFSLLHGKAFNDVGAQIKAVYILYYLVTYQTEAEEDDFEFLKLLVGLDTAQFIEPIVELNAIEKEFCTQILQKFIFEWSVLKNTSIEIIQHNFLQRNGVLRKGERTLDLYLEKSVFDVLLDHFPYNYSLVKLKWLDKLICVVL